MSFFTAKQPKTRSFRAAYREERKSLEAAKIRKEAREAAKQDLLSPRERREQIRQRAYEATGAPIKAKDRVYGRLGGSLTIRKDALKRLKNLKR